jgi:hypothetical protein
MPTCNILDLGKGMIFLQVVFLPFAVASFHPSSSTHALPAGNGSGNSYIRCARKTLESDSHNENPCSTTDIIHWLDEASQPREDAEKEMYQYLHSNMMPFDVPNAESLGFHVTPSNDPLPDGLSNGIVGPTISIALDAKQRYSWTSHVPKDVYFEYVAPFASVNEARNNWRPLFHNVTQQIIDKFEMDSADGSNIGDASVEQIVRLVNQNVWDHFSNTREEPIFFKSGQTPLIYDPMSIIAYGYASCTGLSIFLVDLLRTVGIPARLAGTAAWNGKKENGNHSWIEFFGSDSRWHIMESMPASGGDDENLLDPCQWWFCNEEKVQGTSFYAARFSREDASDNVVFPLAWDTNNADVVGVDRTNFMRDLCSQC